MPCEGESEGGNGVRQVLLCGREWAFCPLGRAWASMRSHLVRGEVDLDGGVSTRVEDLTSDNLGDSHFVCYQKVMGVVGG